MKIYDFKEVYEHTTCGDCPFYSYGVDDVQYIGKVSYCRCEVGSFAGYNREFDYNEYRNKLFLSCKLLRDGNLINVKQKYMSIDEYIKFIEDEGERKRQKEIADWRYEQAEKRRKEALRYKLRSCVNCNDIECAIAKQKRYDNSVTVCPYWK